MKSVALLLLLVGCAGSRTGTLPTDPPAEMRAAAAPATPSEPAAPPAPPMLDEATVKAKTHAWFDAFDRAEVDAVLNELGPSYIEFVSARYYDAKMLRQGMEARRERH